MNRIPLPVVFSIEATDFLCFVCFVKIMYMYNFVYKNDYVLYIYSKVIFLGNAVFTSFFRHFH